MERSGLAAHGGAVTPRLRGGRALRNRCWGARVVHWPLPHAPRRTASQLPPPAMLRQCSHARTCPRKRPARCGNYPPPRAARPAATAVPWEAAISSQEGARAAQRRRIIERRLAHTRPCAASLQRT